MKVPTITINGETVEVNPTSLSYSEGIDESRDRSKVKRIFKRIFFQNNSTHCFTCQDVMCSGKFSQQEKRDILVELIEEHRAENEKRKVKR